MSIDAGKPEATTRQEIGRRLAEERDRLRLNQEAMAAQAGVSKRAYAAWELGESMPAADVLARLYAAGMDVLYVVVARKGGLLAAEESQLVRYYQAAAEAGRRALLQTGEAFAEGAPGREGNVVQTIHGAVGQQVAGDVTNHGAINVGAGKQRRSK